MRRLIGLGVLVILVILAFVGGRLLYYGFGTYTPPARSLPEIALDAYAGSDRLAASDNPTTGAGVVAIDYAHRNDFQVAELTVLLSKVVARGFSYELALDPEEVKGQGLVDKLRYAKALILSVPRLEYTPEEIGEIQRFVEKGGRVLLIGDPTRTVEVEALNSIAGSFGIIYANDYLYNLDTQGRDNNYRNVVYSQFEESPLTQGLDENSQVIFYTAGSINAPGHEIVLADETTHSSTSEGGRTLAAAVLTTQDQVLALGDLTFFSEPYSAAESNGVIINNIADFITGGQRDFELRDFPYFFNPDVDIVFHDPLVFNSHFEDAVKLKELLEQTGHSVAFTSEITSANDVIFVGRFDEAEVVQDYLDAAQITILGVDEKTDQEKAVAQAGSDEVVAPVSDVPADEIERFVGGRIHIQGVGELERGGSSLFYRHRDQGRNVLLILSDNLQANADAFELLLENELAECRLSAAIAVCNTDKPEDRLPPSLRRDRIDKILIVADDDGRERENPQTSLVEFSSALSSTYEIDTWVNSKVGSPDLDTLQNYDAIIWSAGNYWDDSIGEEDVDLLTTYIRDGGNLILSGASIAFDWDHTEFLTNIAHADYLDAAEQSDLELSLTDHPIARDFAAGAVITFTRTFSDDIPGPDVVRHTSDARVIFERGPESEHPGAAAVIAYEDERSKIAYYAFPIDLLPADQRDLLIGNTVNWFTEAILEPPPEAEYEPYQPSDESNGRDSSATEQPADGQDTGSDQGSGEDQGGSGGDQGDGG